MLVKPHPLSLFKLHDTVHKIYDEYNLVKVLRNFEFDCLGSEFVNEWNNVLLEYLNIDIEMLTIKYDLFGNQNQIDDVNDDLKNKFLETLQKVKAVYEILYQMEILGFEES